MPLRILLAVLVALACLPPRSWATGPQFGPMGGGGASITPNSCTPGDFATAIDGSGNLTCSTPAGSGNVSNTGTPVDNQVAIWTDATHIEGDTALTFDTATNTLTTTTFSGALSGNATTATTATTANDLSDAGVDAVLPHLDGAGLMINSATTPDELIVDTTELTGNRTWGDSTDASIAWTYDVVGTNPVVTYGNGVVNVSTGTLQQGGVAVLLDDTGSVDATNLATDSVSADELNATGVATELEAAMALQDISGAVTDAQVPNSITIDTAATATNNTLLAGRAGTGNDTTISTDATGTIYGSNDASGSSLTLRATSANTTTGEIDLNAPRVDLYPSFPASVSTDHVLLKSNPTTTLTGGVSYTMASAEPVLSVADTTATQAFRMLGSVARTGTTGATLYQVTGFYMGPSLTSATTGGPLFQDAFYDGTRVEQTASTATQNTWVPISFLSKPEVAATGTASLTVGSVYGAHFDPSFQEVSGATLAVTDYAAVSVADPRETTGSSGTPAITNYMGVRIEDLSDAMVTNPISVLSEGTTTEMRHAGPARFGATGAPTATFDLDVQGATKVADYMDVGDDIADITTNTTSVVDIAPTVDITANGTLNALRYAPTSTLTGTSLVQGVIYSPTVTLNGGGDLSTFQVVGTSGTITSSPTTASFGPVGKLFNHAITYTASGAGKSPAFSIDDLSSIPTISSSATSGSAAVSAIRSVNHNPTINQTGDGGSLTVTTLTGFNTKGTVTAGTGGTATVTTRRGLYAEDLTTSGAGTKTITTNIGVDVARQQAGTTDIGIRGYGMAMQKVDNSSTCTACTDAHISWNDSSFIRLTGNSVKVVSGIGGGVDGAILYLYNQGSGSLTIDDDDSAAAEDTPASQILTMSGADKVCTGVCVVTMIYDSGASRWVVTAVSD